MTIDSLSRSIAKQLFGAVFICGKGGVLTFLAVLGTCGILIGSWHDQGNLQFAWKAELIFLVVCFLAGYVFFREALRDPDTWRSTLEYVVSCDFPIDEEKTQYQAELKDGLKFACEAIYKILELSKRSEDKTSLSQILDDVIKMLEMQHDSVAQVAEMRRVLELVSGVRNPQGKNDSLLSENIRSIEEYATEAGNMVEDINSRLKTMTLQIVQLEARTSQHKVNATTVAKETAATLQKLQSAVETRKASAAAVISKLDHRR